MRDFLRFILSEADQDRIDVGSIVVEEIPFPIGADAQAPYPESMHLSFRVQDPAAGAPQLRPFFPGQLKFLADHGGGILPDAGEVQFEADGSISENVYETWRTQGQLLVRVVARDVADDLQLLAAPVLGVGPSLAWYWPIRISKEFLEVATHLPGTGLTPLEIIVDPQSAALTPNDPAWRENAISHFLAGNYRPRLSLGASAAEDDAAVFDMPHVVMEPNTGQVDLYVALASHKSPAVRARNPGSNPLNVQPDHPGHPNYAVLPARYVYQHYRTKTLGVAAGVGDAILGQNVFIQRLKTDLGTLGFTDLVGAVNDEYDLQCRWALREFQIYSKMEALAQVTGGAPLDYVSSLQATANDLVYEGPISGVANDVTRRTISHWMRNDFRCPVVIYAWNMAGGARESVHTENIWRRASVTNTGPRMFARDFSGYYAFPLTRNPNDWTVVGNYYAYAYNNVTYGGPVSLPPGLVPAPGHTWAEAEVLTENLVGSAALAMSASQRSTFKVIRSVSEIECLGFFDSVNAYDRAVISVGPCHWTLGIVDRAGGQTSPVAPGELCGYLAYLRAAAPATFDTAIGRFGVRVDEDWQGGAGVGDGRQLWDSSQRKFAGWMAAEGEDGEFASVLNTRAESEYFQTWHWFYRFIMAGRTVDGYRSRMWDMARIRIRDIRATPFPAGTMPDVGDGLGNFRRATLGDVFTSERAMALLLRWHVWLPGDVVSHGEVSPRLQNVVSAAGFVMPVIQDPAGWTDADEANLLTGLMNSVVAKGIQSFTNDMISVRDWPVWGGGNNPRGYALTTAIGGLGAGRNSFNFEASGLPPAP